MAKRKPETSKIKLARPTQYQPDPSHETLFELAAKRQLLKPVHGTDESNRADILVGRMGDAVLWSISLTMLHFTLDVLVTHQYAIEISWPEVVRRAMQAFPVILMLIYNFHPHPEPSILSTATFCWIRPLHHQLCFFVGSFIAGCYFIYAQNEHAYYAVMKQMPPVGCLWIWFIIELDIFWAIGSLICCAAYLRLKEYSFL